jgi:hypothetical protein
MYQNLPDGEMSMFRDLMFGQSHREKSPVTFYMPPIRRYQRPKIHI